MGYAKWLEQFLPFGIPLTLAFYYLLYRLLKVLLVNSRRAPESECPVAAPVRAVEIVVAAAAYIVLTSVAFWPYLGSFSTAIIGPPEDNLVFFWNLHWFSHSLGSDAGFSFTNLIFYPEGVDLAYHSLSWYNLALSVPLRSLFGPVATYNLLILHSFVLSGIGAFLLIRDLIDSMPAALVGGYVFAFSASHVAQALHHLNIASVQFLPFLVVYALRSMKQGGWRNVLPAALFFLLGSLASWTYLVIQTYVLLGLYACEAFRRRQIVLWAPLRNLGLIGGITLLVLSPWLFRLISVATTSPAAKGAGHTVFGADLMAFLTPASVHPVGSLDFMQNLAAHFTGNPWEATVYLGIVPLVITLMTVGRLPGKGYPILALAVVFLLLSLGPVLRVFGHPLPFLLPEAALAAIPGANFVRVPARFAIVGSLGLAVLSSLSLWTLYRQMRFGRYTRAVLVLLVACLAVDLFPRVSARTPVSLPACYEVLTEQHHPRAILDLPGGYVEANTYMMYQTMHGLPIVQGQVARKLKPTLIDRLDTLDLIHQREQLASSGVTHIVMHKNFLEAEASATIERYSNVYDLVYDDSSHTVFVVE